MYVCSCIYMYVMLMYLFLCLFMYIFECLFMNIFVCYVHLSTCRYYLWWFEIYDDSVNLKRKLQIHNLSESWRKMKSNPYPYKMTFFRIYVAWFILQIQFTFEPYIIHIPFYTVSLIVFLTVMHDKVFLWSHEIVLIRTPCMPPAWHACHMTCNGVVEDLSPLNALLCM